MLKMLGFISSILVGVGTIISAIVDMKSESDTDKEKKTKNEANETQETDPNEEES